MKEKGKTMLTSLLILSVCMAQCQSVTLILRRTKCDAKADQNQLTSTPKPDDRLDRALQRIEQLEALVATGQRAQRSLEATVGELKETTTAGQENLEMLLGELNETVSTLQYSQMKSQVQSGDDRTSQEITTETDDQTEGTLAPHTHGKRNDTAPTTDSPTPHPSSSHGLVIETDHPTVYPGLTTENTVNCTIDMEQSPPSVVSLTSIVFSRWNSSLGEYKGLAYINVVNPDQAVTLSDIGAKTSGHVNPDGLSFLSLQWKNPTHDATALYMCEATAFTIFGQYERHVVGLEVQATQPSPEMFMETITELRAALLINDNQLQAERNFSQTQKKETNALKEQLEAQRNFSQIQKKESNTLKEQLEAQRNFSQIQNKESNTLKEQLEVQRNFSQTMKGQLKTERNLGKNLTEQLETEQNLSKNLTEQLETERNLSKSLMEQLETERTLSKTLTEQLETKRNFSQTLTEQLKTERNFSQNFEKQLQTQRNAAQALKEKYDILKDGVCNDALKKWDTDLGKLNMECPRDLPRTCADVTPITARQVTVLNGSNAVLCDTETDGGGWVVIQRRASRRIDFFRDWADYKAGFGELTGNFWLGNELIHQLTKYRLHEIRIDLTYQGKSYYALYDRFSLSGEDDKYRLNLGSWKDGSITDVGGAGGFTYNNNRQFSTKDSDNDAWSKSCPGRDKGGWWYKRCTVVNLNGLWGVSGSWSGMYWYDLTQQTSVTVSEMKVRPTQ